MRPLRKPGDERLAQGDRMTVITNGVVPLLRLVAQHDAQEVLG
jgi:hypothetical protein